MPHFDANLPLQKASELTKTLRSRDTPLPSLLPLARDTAKADSTSSNLFFPRRHEWLLEWIVQRLAEEEGASGREARTAPEFWKFLLHLLQSTPPIAVVGVLRRHGLLGTVSRALSEVPEAQSEEEDVFLTPHEAVSPASNMDIDEVETKDSGAQLLDAVTEVLRHLRLLGKEESSITAMLKGKPEVGAAVLAGYLRLVKSMLGKGKPLVSSWTEEILGIWRGCIWGNADSEKIRAIWAGSCLVHAVAILGDGYLLNLGTDDAAAPPDKSYALRNIKKTIESMVGEYVFSTDVLYTTTAGSKPKGSKPSAEKLHALLAPIKAHTGSLKTLPSFLPELFRVGIQTQVKWRNARPDALVTGVIFEILVELAGPGGDSALRAEAVAVLLAVLVQNGATLPTSTLSEIVRATAKLQTAPHSKPNWAVVEMALKLDFDAILGAESKLSEFLFGALTHADDEDNVWPVLQLVVDAFVTGRDLVGFVERWQNLLLADTAGKHSIWKTDRLAAMFAKTMETSLNPFQIERLVKKLADENDWVVLDAVLRGVSREETETRLAKDALPRVVDSARKQPNSWRAWRTIVRVGETDPQLLTPILADAVHAIEDEQWQNALFAAEIIMRVSEAGNREAFGGLEIVIKKATETLSGPTDWNGNIEQVNGRNFGAAVTAGIVARYLPLMEQVGAGVRQGFVDTLFGAACQPQFVGRIGARSLFQSMLHSDTFYECPGLKDNVLSVLMRNLTPWSDMASDIPTALKRINKDGTGWVGEEKLEQGAFIVESLLAFPLETLKRNIREKMLDTLYIMSAFNVASVRIAIDRLWTVNNASSYMAATPNILKEWFEASRLDDDGPSYQTVRKLLQQTIQNRDQEKASSYLKMLMLMVLDDLSLSADGRLDAPLGFPYLVITELWDWRDDPAIDQEDLAGLLRAHFLNAAARRIHPKSINKKDVTILEWWRTVWALDRADIQAKGKARELALRIAGAVAPRLPGISTLSAGSGRVLHAVVKFVCTVADDADAATKATALAMVVMESPCDGTEQILSQYAEMAARLCPLDFRRLLLWTVDGCFSGDEAVGDGIWPLLNVLIKCVAKPGEEELPETLDVLSFVYNKLVLSISASRSAAAFHGTSFCLETLLREAPWCTTQHSIDMTLAALSRCLSPLTGPAIATSTPDALYTALTSLLGSILALHRYRIRGRHHLVVHVLQQLLSALFTPAATRRKADSATHPAWLLPPPASAPAAPRLTATSARAFARVLTTFCEPPTSTVRTRSGAADLTNSQTAREKELVAAVAGNVLECYVKRVLDARMDPAVRDEVRLGLATVLAVLKRDGVARVSARVDVPARAVVRGLWREWTEERGEMLV